MKRTISRIGMDFLNIRTQRHGHVGQQSAILSDDKVVFPDSSTAY